MKETIYIPKTITIGFQNRSDTFTKKLAYIIYTDGKGILRKQASWDSWRDKGIPTVTFSNDPTSGFIFNKGVRRDGYWGSGRSVIRVYDSRDFEFEISIDNMIGILMHSDVSKREIVEKCVFAWYGPELVLLPVNSLEYESSVKYTNRIDSKFSAKELVPGHSYIKKDDGKELVYLGLRDWYKFNDSGGIAQKKSRRHIFVDPTSKTVYTKLNPSSHISGVAVQEIHPSYSDLCVYYLNRVGSRKMVSIEIVPTVSLDRFHTSYAIVDNFIIHGHFSNGVLSNSWWSPMNAKKIVLEPELSFELNYREGERRGYYSHMELIPIVSIVRPSHLMVTKDDGGFGVPLAIFEDGTRSENSIYEQDE